MQRVLLGVLLVVSFWCAANEEYTRHCCCMQGGAGYYAVCCTVSIALSCNSMYTSGWVVKVCESQFDLPKIEQHESRSTHLSSVGGKQAVHPRRWELRKPRVERRRVAATPPAAAEDDDDDEHRVAATCCSIPPD